MSQRYRTFIVTPLSLYQWKLAIFLLYIFIILRILHKWNHNVCDLLGIDFFHSFSVMLLRSIQVVVSIVGSFLTAK